MAFPQVKRVIYNKSPLEKVICQFRYPPILRIDSELPSEFQEYIRESFPLYSEKVEIIQGGFEGVGQLQNEGFSPGIKKSLTIKNHLFSTDDRTWNINLSRTFLSITTSKYTVWEDFISKFQHSINALFEIYKPPFITRIGLRYIDIFNRSGLGLKDINWTELINPYFLGLLSSSIGDDIRNYEGRYEINLEDKESILRVVTTFVDHLITKERCYLVDCDYYYPKKTNRVTFQEKLEFLHEQATRLIQFIITKKLHNAMEPKELL
jgi:uncharacterized protein (TIGR04255 family)